MDKNLPEGTHTSFDPQEEASKAEAQELQDEFLNNCIQDSTGLNTVKNFFKNRPIIHS